MALVPVRVRRWYRSLDCSTSKLETCTRTKLSARTRTQTITTTARLAIVLVVLLGSYEYQSVPVR
eukprot:scaffold467420_cov36-Prasinocladus_malaysianus.AAC.1